MITIEQTNEFNRLYKELIDISNEILPYYDIDKIKPYAVYIWSKEIDDDFGENLFDIHPDTLYFYNEQHKINKDCLPIIEKIQSKLKDIEKYLVKY